MNFELRTQIKMLLDSRKMTIKDLADELEMSRQSMSQKINNNNFTIEQLHRVATALNTSISINFAEFQESTTSHDSDSTQPLRRGPGRPASSDKPKEKQPKTKEIKINPKYADIAKYIEENNNKPGMDVFDEDYPEHIPGTKVAVDEYSKWKLDLFNRPEIPVPDEDLIPPDDIYQWRIYRSATGERSWEFAYSSPPDPRTYWGSGPTIDYPSANHTEDDPRNYSGALKL